MNPPAIRDPQTECMPRGDLEQLQLERLQATLNRTYRSVTFYRRRFEELGLTPEDFQSLGDLARLPLTEKDDLRAGYPYALFAVPLREVVRMHMSAGTTGAPSVVGYTDNDLRHLANLVARNLVAAGVTKDDVVEIFFGPGSFTSGFGFHYGAETIGASVLPLSLGETHRQVEVIRDFRTTVLIGTPDYALRLVQAVDEMGLDPHELSLRTGIFGGEPWSEHTRRTIEERLLLRAYDSYSLAEVGGPGVAFECEQRSGLHVAEDQFLIEVVDPETGEPMPPGEEGELVFTTLNKEAFPLLRIRSGDIGALDTSPCACGRTHARMGRVTRHADDRVVVRGVCIFPRQIEAVVASIEGLSPDFQVVVDRGALLERVEVHIQLAPDTVPDLLRRLVLMESQVRGRLEEELGLVVDVKLGAYGAIPRGAPRTRIISEPNA